jgi:hypothetical protein
MSAAWWIALPKHSAVSAAVVQQRGGAMCGSLR